MRRPLALRLLFFAAAPGAAAPCAAQVEARLDAAAAVVKYDGYLSSGAAALTPSLTWRSAYTTVAARGTLLFFESGNSSLQGLLSASTFSPNAGPGRVEIAAEASGSAYGSAAQFLHGLGHARVHLMWSRGGIWAGGLAGVVVSKFGMLGASSASGVATGLWARAPAGALEVTWTHVAVSHMAYSDLQARARWLFGRFDLEAAVGSRWQSHAIGSSAYGNVSGALRLTDRIELVAAAGSYPSDPVRGTIPGRFVSAGARLALRPSTPLAVAQAAPEVPTPGARGSLALLDARVAVEPVDGQPVLVVFVAGDHLVEVTGDFTDWRPVALLPDGAGRYRYAPVVPAGLHRFNLRVDGGPWGVPEGVAVDADEFGGSVGVLVVP